MLEVHCDCDDFIVPTIYIVNYIGLAIVLRRSQANQVVQRRGNYIVTGSL